MVDSVRKARRFLISGQVQGVGFRQYTRRQARALDLSGHAMNLPDGRVEVIAIGTPAALDRMAKWLSVGSPHGKVTEVVGEEIEPLETAGFEIGWLAAVSLVSSV
jgi:acylphosphatase